MMWGRSWGMRKSVDTILNWSNNWWLVGRTTVIATNKKGYLVKRLEGIQYKIKHVLTVNHFLKTI